MAPPSVLTCAYVFEAIRTTEPFEEQQTCSNVSPSGLGVKGSCVHVTPELVLLKIPNVDTVPYTIVPLDEQHNEFHIIPSIGTPPGCRVHVEPELELV